MKTDNDLETLLSVSIVIYKNNPKILKQTVDSVLASSLVSKLFIIDNSPTNQLQATCEIDSRITYIFNDKNLGFGKAHNVAMKQSIQQGYRYHLVLNPDVYFEGYILNKIIEYMNQNDDIGLLMPKILYPDGTMQHLCKLLPTPSDLFLRRFLGNTKQTQEMNERYELRLSGYNKTMNVPYLSGCFMFFRNKALKDVGLFDERIFMYIEDCDITRRIHRKYKTIFWPEVSINHYYAKGSYKNLLLFFYNIHGVIIYFNKYGWFFDKERDEINQKVLQETIKSRISV